ncbi:MAG: glycoside hydrolase family 127 protein [Armatimonadetes bacterium]|nr:glycoside hydrolase family 127 protein [Armatimonadota bacterium]
MLVAALMTAILPRSHARPLVKLEPVPFTQVTVQDRFWSPRRETNRKVSLAHSLDQLEKAGNIEDLELAAAGKRTGFKGLVFMDSDLYKTIEACSYSLATDPDPALSKRLDGVIEKIAAAQMPDGYLNTYYQINAPDKRFTNLAWNHELYCAGHLFEAAVAHHAATGRSNLLSVATKFADLLCRTFGDGPGQREGYCGHPEIELALVKLWKETGNREYFRLANYFIEARGSKFFAKEQGVPLDKYDGEYYQDNVPIREHDAIVGHAVRAGYLMSGVVDVARETGDDGLLQMVDRVWKNTVLKKMYLTGGIGPSGSNEGFTVDYDLPNATAYQETCASVAMVMWNHRLAVLYGDARYADVMERSLYNGVLAGYSMDGKRYFYVNPLESRGGHHRQDWFGCACCPPNVARTLAQLGGYAYATSSEALWVNLFVQGSVKARVAGGDVKVDVKTDYPWDGTVEFTVRSSPQRPFGLRVRIPDWCRSAKVQVNGRSTSLPATTDGYAEFKRSWKPGDRLTVRLDMPARAVQANPMVKDDAGKLAYMRGPLVYCAEQTDNEAPLDRTAIPAMVALDVVRRPDLFGGAVVLKAHGTVSPSAKWEGGLYRDAGSVGQSEVTMVPYYAWDNRKAGLMKVWFPVNPPPPVVAGLEHDAKVSLSFVSGNAQPSGINDGAEPKSSGEQPAALTHWWPHKGGTEWVQYTWTKPVTTGRLQVYWFDDTGRGECRLPESWKVEYESGGTWKPIEAKFDVKKDSWCEATFRTVTTQALRLSVKMKDGWAAGIHEWRVWAAGD